MYIIYDNNWIRHDMLFGLPAESAEEIAWVGLHYRLHVGDTGNRTLLPGNNVII